jgi:hypothetical protein
MPKPYKNYCVDYTKFGFSSRTDCIIKCRLKYFRDHYERWPGVYLTENLTNDYMFDAMEVLLANESLDFVLGKSCTKKCGSNTDCLKETFYLKKSEEIDLDFNSTVFIFPPNLPSLKFENSPKIQVEEFICFIASIVSLWFGFSIIMLSDVCSLIFTIFVKIVNNYKT